MTNSKTVKQDPIVFEFMQDIANENEFCVVTDISEFIDMEKSYLAFRREIRAAMKKVRAGELCAFQFRIMWIGYRFAAKAYFKAFHETKAVYEDAMI
jgi:hypothetical protein